MRRYLVTATVLAGLCSWIGSASAADAFVDPGYDWTGVYAGVHAGYAWGETKAFDSDDDTDGDEWALLGGQFDTNVDGFVAGGQLGYNMQINQIVLGVEGDLGWLGVKGDNNWEAVIPTTIVETDGGLYGTFRGRLGFAFDRVLVFGTGGLIVADLDSKVFDDVNIVTLGDAKTDTRFGWTAGGGVEYAVDDSWSVKLEYLYYDLGKERVYGIVDGVPGSLQAFDVKNTGNIVRAGINFRF